MRLEHLGNLLKEWNGANGAVPQSFTVAGADAFKSYTQGFFFDLAVNLNKPLMSMGPMLRCGRNSYIAFLRYAQASRVNHVAMNLKVSRRPAREVLE